MKWTCESCGESHEEQFDSCWKCATRCDGTAPITIPKPEVCRFEAANRVKMPCSTTPNIPGREIAGIKGIVCGEAIMGANLFRGLMASLTDIVGGRSGGYESKLREGRTIALQEMMGEAKDLGADAVVGVDIDYETVGQTMLMVSASGTAVILNPEKVEQALS